MFGLTILMKIIAYFWQLLERAFDKMETISFKKETKQALG